MIGYTNLFEFPEMKNLEEDIKKEFGSECIETLKKTKIQFQTKIDPLPELKYKEKGDLFPEPGGKVYSIFSDNIKDIRGFSAEGNIAVKAQEMIGRRQNTYLTLIDVITKNNKAIRFSFEQPCSISPSFS
jgi:hypothetical protein